MPGLALAAGILRRPEFMESPTRGDSAAEARALPESDPPDQTEGSGIRETASGAEGWRSEVAARLERYRARRRPRAPRYPSLFLPFDSSENRSRSGPTAESSPPSAPTLSALMAGQSVALQLDEVAFVEPPPAAQLRVSLTDEPASSAKIIEFPRSAAVPDFHVHELAEPVLDRPRIVEAPEIVPPAPALGGMLIEPIVQSPATTPASEDVPLHSAGTIRRALAGLVDGLILTAGLAGFTAIIVWLNPGLAPSLSLAAGLAPATVLLWMGYEFLFVVYSGTTPGLRTARLRLARFDGSPLGRRLRRWRVLASFLSAFSLGLGYLWSLLDQDGLCWHDRMTRTYVQYVTDRPSDSPQ